MNKNKRTTHIVIVILALIIAAVAIWRVVSPSATYMTNSAGGSAIVSAVTTNQLDSKGNAVGQVQSFNAMKDRIVYVVLYLQNATKHTQLAYTRYLNGKYIDSKTAYPGADGISSFHFTFEKGVGTYPTGNYAVNLYVNGRKSGTVQYAVK